MKKFNTVAALAIICAGCAALGFTDKVLLRVPSPDGRLVAVCQEIPVFDGPEFDVRVERADGTLPRAVARLGDASRCTEMAWSDDGRMLAVLTGHVARVTFVDVEWALQQPKAERDRWFWQQVAATGARLSWGRNLRFIAAREVQLEVCPYRVENARENQYRCTEPPATKRFGVPTPVQMAH